MFLVIVFGVCQFILFGDSFNLRAVQFVSCSSRVPLVLVWKLRVFVWQIESSEIWGFDSSILVLNWV